MNRPALSQETGIEDALNVFRESAAAVNADQRVFDRLLDVQSLLGKDLEWVETALEEAAREGLSPATDAVQHLISRGGKRVRPLLAMLACGCFGPISPRCKTIALVAEITHTATLLHDDVTDEGMERRGAATSRRLWGNAVSVLAGDLLLIHALTETFTETPSVIAELFTTMRALIDGEVLQLRGRTELIVSEDHYTNVVRGKTASLFAWTASSGAIMGGATHAQAVAMRDFGTHLGIAFQMVDDVLDYVGGTTGKTGLADLREGKLSLPLVLAVRRIPELITDLLKIHAGDLSLVDAVAAKVVESGACEEVRVRAREETARALRALEGFPNTPHLRLLRGVAEDLVARMG